jgi:hypothetical protein
MTDSNIDPSPDDVIMLIPLTLDFMYDQDAEGGDVLGIIFEDQKTGPMMLTLTPFTAKVVAANLTSLINNLDDFRRRYTEGNRHA